MAGNGAGLTWTTSINSADLASLANGSSVLSSVADIANGTNLDQFMDLSVRCAIASSTIAAGANLALWLYALLDDGSTYGDGQLVAGTQAVKTPVFAPCATIPLVAAASQTTLVGAAGGVFNSPYNSIPNSVVETPTSLDYITGGLT
ncbi:hypothetical protein AS156_00995 [Bradyrhizobium macuxiense]|uniref:Uncharacterized protein n=1 Tax=Bradyrhizobium macuxiense TaxID=1755647 RepID=A0A120FMT6_9BRAD|nr:hypothetical protein AS156_00995 [Bradyrhizobium macuxiense]